MNRPEANSVIVLDHVVTFASPLTAAYISFAVSPRAQTASQSPHCSPRLFVVFQNFSCLFTVLGFSVKQMFPDSWFYETLAAQ